MPMQIMMMPVYFMLLAGVLNFGNIFMVGQDLQRALDAATLAAANEGEVASVTTPGVGAQCYLDPSDAEAAAMEIFNENFEASLAPKGVEVVDVEFNPTSGDDATYSQGKIEMKVSVTSPTAIMNFLGFDGFTIERTAWATCSVEAES